MLMMKMKILQFAVVLICMWSSAAQDGERSSSNDNNDAKNAVLKNIINELDNLKKENQALKAELVANKQELRSALSLFLNQSSALDSKVENLDQKIKMPKIAFSATLSNLETGHKFFRSSSDMTLIYKNDFTNIGNAYSPHTGVFTAPERGLYFFSFTVFKPYDGSVSRDQQVATLVSLMKNGAKIVTVSDNAPGVDTEDTGAGSACLLLERGDQVYLMLWKECTIYTDSNKRNTFSGHLLFTV